MQTGMVDELLFVVFVALSAWGTTLLIRQPWRFATFAVVSSAVWTAYIAPQAFGILYNPNPYVLPPQVFDLGFGMTMVMSSACVLAGYLGAATARPPRVATHVRGVDPRWLFRLGLIAGAIGIFSQVQVVRESGGVLLYYSVGGAFALDWLGDEVIYTFIATTTQIIAIILISYSMFMQFSLVKLLALVAVAAFPVADVLILNKRSDAIHLSLAVAIPAYFCRGWVPSRPALLGGILAAMFVVFAFPIIRGTLLLGAEGGGLGLFEVIELASEDVFGDSGAKEFNNSIGVIAAYERSFDFSLGANTYNSWVAVSVPSSIMGGEFVSSLMFDVPHYSEMTRSAIAWTVHPFKSISAAARLFADFYLLGAIAFFFIGRFFSTLFMRSLQGDSISRLYYCMLITLLPHWIAVGFSKLPREVISVFLVMILVEKLAGVEKPLRAVRAAQ